MKYLITLMTLSLALSTQAFAGPGKKHHRPDAQLSHEQAIPGLYLEDDAILIRTSPVVEEKVLEASIVNNETVSPIENRLSERAEIRLSKAEKRLNNKIDKLQKDPNRTFWNSSGNRWIIIGLVFLLASILFYIFPGLGILGALCSLVGIVLIIVGLLIGLDAI
jgi:hypothetical protein